VYFLDYNGQICGVEKIDVESDQAAIVYAEKVREGNPVDVWNERKAIARLREAVR
jgi:hypothetical protein